MFRKVTLGALAAALVVAVAAGSAGASGGPVTRDWFKGKFAESSWTASSGGVTTYYGVLVAREETGAAQGTTHLFLDECTGCFDADGNFIGGVDVSGETSVGVSFSIDTVKYTAASASGTVPLTRCLVDASGNASNCTDAGDSSVVSNWTGVGPIPHQPTTYPFYYGGCLFVDHSSTIERLATADIALDGVAVQPDSVGLTGFGIGNGGLITVCPHG
jgi:hypothetical protein